MAAQDHIDLGAKFPYDRDLGRDAPARPAVDWAEAAARGIMANLGDRRGIDDALDDVDPDVRVEIMGELADIIRAAHAGSASG